MNVIRVMPLNEISESGMRRLTGVDRVERKRGFWLVRCPVEHGLEIRLWRRIYRI
jgi:hypothetical protein